MLKKQLLIFYKTSRLLKMKLIIHFYQGKYNELLHAK